MAEVNVKVPSVGRMPRPYCAEFPSGISPHYSAVCAKNTNRKEVPFCCYIITLLHRFLFFLGGGLPHVITALRLAVEVYHLKFAGTKSK